MGLVYISIQTQSLKLMEHSSSVLSLFALSHNYLWVYWWQVYFNYRIEIREGVEMECCADSEEKHKMTRTMKTAQDGQLGKVADKS